MRTVQYILQNVTCITICLLDKGYECVINKCLICREQVHSLEAKVADLEKHRESARLFDKNLGDVIAASHSQDESSLAAMDASWKESINLRKREMIS